MAQVKYSENFFFQGRAQAMSRTLADSVTFFGYNFLDSISLNTLNIILSNNISESTRSVTVSLGLYSLNGTSLALVNSASLSYSASTSQYIYYSATAISSTQNITPGSWYWGMVCSFNTTFSFYIRGASNNLNIPPTNAFPIGFVRGAMTASTNAMPASVATSDLDITGVEAITAPYIVISA